jgi:uncharacterized membrane-anchored protein
VSEQAITSEQAVSSWRLKLGVVLFLFSIALPLLGIPMVAAIGLSTTMTASVSGGLLVGAEVLGLLAVVVMGKSGFAFIKTRIFGFLKQYGPPKDVSRRRYTIGLVMFFVPVIFGWISIYVSDFIPGFTNNPLAYAIGGDLLLLMSLIVLGGNFWDKIRALFIYDAKIYFREENIT